MPGISIRDGKPADLAALCEIEQRSFASDQLSRRSFRRLLASPSAAIRVGTADGGLAGYHVFLTRAGSAVARLYSVAVAASARGRGFGEKLLADAERVARRRGAETLRLEVRTDNAAAIRLYERRGYTCIGTYRRYYADKADALRYERRLGPPRARATAGNEEDRSPADFGISTLVMRLSPQHRAERGFEA